MNRLKPQTIWTLVTGILLSFISVVPAHAQASINGALSNFDTFNDSGVEAHGFEIELDGVSASDVQYWFGAPYNRYGTPVITNFTNGNVSGAKVRWESQKDSNGNYLQTTAMSPANPTPTNGHECYLYGPAGATQQQYDASGCEHFGLGLLNNPTKEIYNWLVDDPSNHGTLIYANTPVSIPAPTWSISNNGNVAAVIPAPAPQPVAALPAVPNCALWGEAVWMKVYKTESQKPARLGALLTDSKEVPENAAEVETEWEFLQGRPTCDDTGKPLDVQPANELVHEAAAGVGAESVTRRFEIFKYTGAYDDSDGGNHEALPLCDSNPYKLNCSDPAQLSPNSDLGAYVGAQMAAANLVAAGLNSNVVSVTKTGDGTGIVSDSTGGITCGDLCGGSYSTGSTITLTAAPDAGYRVGGWSIPGCNNKTTCSFTLTADTTVTVAFVSQANAAEPTISGTSSTSLASGQTLTINGTNLSTLADVQFQGISATVLALTDTSVSVKVPCGATTGVVTVITDGGTVDTASITIKTGKPTITSFTPTSGFPGSTVTVKGTFLGCLTNLNVGGKASIIGDSSYSETSLTVANDAITGYLTALNNLGSGISKTKYTVIPNPSITSFSPSHVLPGATVTVIGTSLKGISSASINGTTAKTKLTGTTTVTVTVPLGASSGNLVLHLPSGDLVANSQITVDTLPATLTSVSTVVGAVGTSVVLKGTNFYQGTRVTIGSKAALVTVVSPTLLVFTVASGTTTGTLKVDNGGGSVNWNQAFTVSGTVSSTITKASSKSAIGATVITITGTNLGNLSSVRVAGTDSVFTVLSNTSAVLVLPIGARAGTITATTQQGSVITGPAITVLAGAALPTATAVTPTSAVVGAWVKVTGANLAGTKSVSWGEVATDFYVSAANSIYVKVPPGASTATVSITTDAGSVQSKPVKVS